MSRLQSGFVIFKSLTREVSSAPHENSGQNPIPMFAAIIFFTEAGLSLSNIMFGFIPASAQYLSQIERRCFEPRRETNPHFCPMDFIPSNVIFFFPGIPEYSEQPERFFPCR